MDIFAEQLTTDRIVDQQQILPPKTGPPAMQILWDGLNCLGKKGQPSKMSRYDLEPFAIHAVPAYTIYITLAETVFWQRRAVPRGVQMLMSSTATR